MQATCRLKTNLVSDYTETYSVILHQEIDGHESMIEIDTDTLENSRELIDTLTKNGIRFAGEIRHSCY